MKVYVLLVHIEPLQSSVYGVYSTLDKAKFERDQYIRTFKRSIYSVDIEEMTVE